MIVMLSNLSLGWGGVGWGVSYNLQIKLLELSSFS